MRLILFRHAEKENQGHRDNPPLSKAGLRQAQGLTSLILSGALPRPNYLFASPKIRALQTFESASNTFAIDLVSTPELDEKTPSESQAVFRKRIQAFCNRVEGMSGIVFLCTHFDWLEEFCALVTTHEDLSSINWATGHYLEFEISDRQWLVMGQGDIL